MSKGRRAYPELNFSTKIPEEIIQKDGEQTKMCYNHIQVEMESTPLMTLVLTWSNYLFLIIFGHIKDIISKFFKPNEYAHLRVNKGYAPLVSDFDSLYTRRLYTRIRDCWNRPMTGTPGRLIHLLDRTSHDFNKTFSLTGKVTENINFGSYNYLGFAQNVGPCADAVETSMMSCGISTCSTSSEVGVNDLHVKLEKVVAKFLGKQDSMVISMGFATNSTTIPALISKGCLIISDELNHSSIILGARLSNADIRTFKHNDMIDLENLLRNVISQGQPRTHRPWKKIVVIVEGLYSMEGTIVDLPGLVALKKRYKFYLYVDEAHSIGAMGSKGGGVCDLYRIDPAEVDILMGTFTKSFGSAGGYISADKNTIDYLKLKCHARIYAESVSIPVSQQIITSMEIIAGDDGTDEGESRINQLANNSLYFSTELRKLGFIVYGDIGSPVIPLLLFQPAKIAAFSRELLKVGIIVVVVGYPATPIISSRARFCISASHTKEDLDYALSEISRVGTLLNLKISKRKTF